MGLKKETRKGKGKVDLLLIKRAVLDVSEWHFRGHDIDVIYFILFFKA